MGGWVYAQAMSAQEKTNNFLGIQQQQSDGEYNSGKMSAGEEVRSDDLVKKDQNYWMKQAEYWKTIAKKWNGGDGSK